MRAVVADRPGGEEVLRVAEVEAPGPPGPGELGIRVTAAGLNRADLLQRRGLYPPPAGASPALGLECSGEVCAVGEGVRGWEVGERVMALLTGGGQAEQVNVAAGCAMHVPGGLTDAQAGGLPEAFLTAFINLFLLGGLQRGGTAVVHGGSGGVGTAAIQLVREAGSRIVVTAGSPSRCRRCLELGAHVAVDYHGDDWVAAALELSGGAGVDVVLDCIGAPYLDSHLKVLTTGGRLVVIGLMGGARGEADLARLLQRRITVIGSTLRSRPVSDKVAFISAFEERFGHALAGGALQPVVHQTLRFHQVADAHRLLAAGEVFGKLVLLP